jgi:hypothetical protein
MQRIAALYSSLLFPLNHFTPAALRCYHVALLLRVIITLTWHVIDTSKIPNSGEIIGSCRGNYLRLGARQKKVQ